MHNRNDMAHRMPLMMMMMMMMMMTMMVMMIMMVVVMVAIICLFRCVENVCFEVSPLLDQSMRSAKTIWRSFFKCKNMLRRSGEAS